MEGRPFLRCLGQPALFSPSGEPIRFRTKKHLALLVYLAVETGKPHRRERLAELLWPKVDVAEGRHSLATALSVLRPRLGPHVIEATREHVVLVAGRIELDLERLQLGEVLATDTRGALQVAGFLEGFEIADSPEFSLWKDRKSASLIPAIKAALIQLIDQCRRTADSREIEHLADIMLTIDDLSEEAVRAKMEARAFAGDRLTALRIFEEWRTKLADALGAQPSTLVEGMAVRLRRRGWERTDLTEIPTVPTDQWRGRSFIGRSDEYRLLYEAWEYTKRGGARHGLVLGDSGIGKTTLLNRLATAAGLEGAAISRAQCYDLEKEIPYATLGNLALGLLDLPGVSGTPPEALAELAKYFTGVRRRFPTIPLVEESQGETARLRLTEAFHQALETIAEEHPVILVVDDLHLCDEASLAVLHLLIHRVATQPIMFALAARAGELPRSPIAARLRLSTDSLHIQKIELRPLSGRQSHEVLGALLGADRTQADSTLRRAMVRASGGFPMVLELLVQDWEANGSRSLALALDSMTADYGSTNEVPELYRRVLDRLVFALDQSTKNVLNVAAVLGHRLNDMSLYATADLGPGQVMAAMADLVGHRILRDGGRGLEFVNELIRTAAYLDVPSPVRRVLHAAIAARLMEEKTRGVGFLGLEIAWHAIRAGQTEGLAAYLLEGATEAISQGSLDTAARALSTALPQLVGQERITAALLLVEALQEQGRWAESASVLASDCNNDSSGLSTVFSILAAHRTAASTADQLVRDIQHLQAIVESSKPPRVRLRAVNAAAQLMGDVRDQAVADALSVAVAIMRDDDLVEDERIQLKLCQAQLLYYSGRQGATLDRLNDLAAHFNVKGIANSQLVRVYGGLGAVHCYEGKYQDAKSDFHSGYTIAVRIGNEPQQAIMAAQLALCSLRLGEYAEQLEWSKTAALAGPFSRYQELQVAYYRASALAMLGDTAEALQVISTLQSRIAPDSPLWLIQACRLLRADVLCLCGHYSAALAQAKEAIAFPQPTLFANSFAGAFARWLALVAETEQSTTTTRDLLRDLGSQQEGLDTIDRAEVTCARLIVGDPESVELRSQLAQHLAGLPPAVATQLQRLGVLRISPSDPADLPKPTGWPSHLSRSDRSSLDKRRLRRSAAD